LASRNEQDLESRSLHK